MVAPTGISTSEQAVETAPELDELDVCEALYWLRRARLRDDAVMVNIWTVRMNDLLEQKFAQTAAR